MTSKQARQTKKGTITLKQLQDIHNKLIEMNTCKTHKVELELCLLPISACPKCREVVLPNKLAKLFRTK